MQYINETAQHVLIQSISRDTWAPLDFQLFSVITGQAGRRSAQIVRQILGVPDDGGGRQVEYGRTHIYNADAFGCRIARCYHRASGFSGPMYWWRSWSLDTTDEMILDSARAELLPAAHLHGHAPPVPDLSAPQLPLTLPARSTSTDRAELSDSELRCEIDRVRQQLRDLEAIAANRVALLERTIALLRGAA